MSPTLSHLKEKARPFVTVALNLCFPPRCSACEAITESPHGLCLSCFAAVEWIADPQCACCGMPFAAQLGADALCGACLASQPIYASARAAMAYGDVVRPMVARFKYQDQTHHAAHYAGWMARAGAELLRQSDLLVPVPLHPRRLWQRRFNQSALLAQHLAARLDKLVLPEGLLRIRNTPPQANLPRAERLENVKGAFRVNHRYAEQLRGKTVELIDDVMTTGATIDACAKALLGGSARAVHVMTLARTIRE